MTSRHLESVLAALLVAANLGAASAHAEDLGVDGYGNSTPATRFALDAGVADLSYIDAVAGNLDGEHCSEYLDAVGMLPLREQWPLLGRLGAAHVNLDVFDRVGSGTRLNPTDPTTRAQYSLTGYGVLRPECALSRPSLVAPGPSSDGR